MYQAGLLNCEFEATSTGRIIDVLPFDLTWQRREFLNKIGAEASGRQ